jgi:hypothetical protein
VVNDDSRSAIYLLLDRYRREAKVFAQSPNLVQRQHHPEASVDEVSHLVSQEFPVQVG